jgi:hypothetical protein
MILNSEFTELGCVFSCKQRSEREMYEQEAMMLRFHAQLLELVQQDCSNKRRCTNFLCKKQH